MSNLYKFIFKRILDLLFSFIIISVLLPILLVIAILILKTSKGKIFFTQERIGKDGSPFLIYKFRTMTTNTRSIKRVLLSDPEVTSVGRFLRRFKLDEIPQLLNVIKGDMSIIGPRPIDPDKYKTLSQNAYQRLLVRPGLTGLAQVNGNIHISWEDRWELDIKYIENLNLFLDISIAFKTVVVIILGEEKFIN